MFGYMIFSHEKYHHDVNVQHFFYLCFVWFLLFFHVFSWFFMIFHVFLFFKKMNQQVQVWCKFAANLHQTCTPSFVFFCFFLCFFLFFNMFFYMFLFMWFIVFLWKPFGISGQQMDYNSMCPGFLNTIYIYIYLVTTTLFSKPKSNMYFQHVSGKCTMAASNPSTQLNFFLKNWFIFIFSNPLIKGQHWVGNKTHT